MSATTEHLLIRNMARDYAEGTESQSYLRQVRRAAGTVGVMSNFFESEDEFSAHCIQYEQVKINRGAVAFTTNGDLDNLVVRVGQRAYEAESVTVRTKQTTIQDEDGFITDVRIKNRRTMCFTSTNTAQCAFI